MAPTTRHYHITSLQPITPPTSPTHTYPVTPTPTANLAAPPQLERRHFTGSQREEGHGSTDTRPPLPGAPLGGGGRTSIVEGEQEEGKEGKGMSSEDL